MKKFRIQIKFSTHVQFDVEADSYYEAMEKTDDLVDCGALTNRESPDDDDFNYKHIRDEHKIYYCEKLQDD